MVLPFYKYHGAGNDFVMIDGRDLDVNLRLNARVVAGLCDRRFGIGADGLIVLRPGVTSDFSMEYYNADGHPGSMCGNGGRCIFRFARDLGYVDTHARFDAADGVHEVFENNDGTISLRMNVKGGIKELMSGAFELNTGSPHYVIRVADVDQVDAYKEGKAIRNSPEYQQEGINVNFISLREGVVYMKTYERGVEDETYSCGTGVTAAAMVAIANGWSHPPVQVSTRGGMLEVSATYHSESREFEDLWLNGPAEYVFRGEIQLQ